jgi:hypothetical protein
MIKEEQLENMLYEKMQKEYDLFLEKIKSEQLVKPNQTIELAIVYKQDILYCFEDGDLNLSYKEKKHLLSKKRPLEFLYQEWLATDCTHMQMIRDCIKDSTGHDLDLTQEQKQKYREER